MKFSLVLSLVIVAGCALLAESIKDQPAAAPAISAELRAQYWRAAKSMSDAQAQAIAAKASLDAIAREMAQACGSAHNAVIDDKTGEPACLPKKPEAKK